MFIKAIWYTVLIIHLLNQRNIVVITVNYTSTKEGIVYKQSY